MENKINIAELLKDCPIGMELDCAIFNDVTLYRIDTSSENEYPIRIETKNGNFLDLTKYGTYSNVEESKCVIFPKGKTTWEGFVPPCEFKDGDIVATTDGLWIGITTGGKIGKFIPTYCVIKNVDEFEAYLDRKESWVFNRLATEEEKAKLFDAIKANGYYWNTETKTLEKLITPKFKVGDKIQSVISSSYYTVVDIKNDLYFIKSDTEKYPYQISFSNERNYELVTNKFDITTLKPFDKVLVRDKDTDEWIAHLFSHYHKNSDRPYVCIGAAGINEYKQCVPYEGNEHLLDTNNNCDKYFKTW